MPDAVTKQSGFTLFELVLAMVVMSIMAAPFVYQKVEQFQEDRVEVTVAEINDVFQSAQNYAAEQGGDWPSEADNCASAMTDEGYLEGFSVRSPYGTDMTTSCTTGNGKRFIVTVDTSSSGNAEILGGYLPSSTVTNSILSVSVPMPAAIPALDHLLPRDGSREMTGDLNMDRNNILNTEQLDTETVLLNSIVTQGNACTTNGMVARDNDGRVLSCVSGQWTGAEGSPAMMVAYFNSPTCPNGWTESNGTNGTIDLRGEFIRGWDHGRGVDSGRARNTLQDHAMQRMTGTVGFYRGVPTSANGVFQKSGSGKATFSGPGPNRSATNRLAFDNNGAVNTAQENRPRNRAMLVCQKQP